jgi:hypothetical protein
MEQMPPIWEGQLDSFRRVWLAQHLFDTDEELQREINKIARDLQIAN